MKRIILAALTSLAVGSAGPILRYERRLGKDGKVFAGAAKTQFYEAMLRGRCGK